MLTEQNQVRFRVISSTDKSWYISYPGFNSLLTENGNDENGHFCTGLGEVMESVCSEYGVGDMILFSGFCNSVSDEYITAKNSIVRADSSLKEISEELGVVTQMVYAVSLLNPEAGMKFYVSSEIEQAELLGKIIEKLGCSVASSVDSAVSYDGAILLDKYCGGLKLNASAKTVYLKGEAGSTVCNSLGQDFETYKYMVKGCEVPRQYLHLSTNKNIETAYRLLSDIKEKASKDDPPPFSLSADCAVQKLKAEYDGHINPGAMSVFVCGKDVKAIERFCRGVAKYVSGAEAEKEYTRQVGQNIVFTIKMKNGTAVDCFALESKSETIDIELHFDRTSVIYKRGSYQLYKGDKSFMDKKKTVSLTSGDMRKLVEFGQSKTEGRQ